LASPFSELGQRSRYSDWLRAGRQRGRVKNVLLSTSSIPALGPTQPIRWVLEILSPVVKWPGSEADHSPPTSTEVKKNVDLYIHYPIRLHGVVQGQLLFLTGSTALVGPGLFSVS
jgi:hypothetical protein